MIDAGQLTKRITIDEPTVSREAGKAGTTTTWAQVAEVWAQPLFRGGREFVAASQVHSDLEVIWVVRSGITIHNRMRVVHNGQVFDIISVDSLSDNDKVRLYCKSGQRQGS